MQRDLRIAAGEIIVLRLYDVAYAIDLARAESVTGTDAPTARSRLEKAQPKAISFGQAPVEVVLGRFDIPLTHGPIAADATARAYDFGAVAIALRIGIADASWDDLVDTVVEADRALQTTGSGVWSDLLERVRMLFGPALIRPADGTLEEDYLLTIVRQFDPPIAPADLLHQVDLAPLLLRDRQPLSDSARRELLRHTFTYYRNDFVALTRDHAFILEPGENMDVADVLEVANAQLLELRYYDELLDAELPKMYERVEQARASLVLSRRRYADLARQLYRLVAEVTEISERIDNALVVTEDVYLARIYGAALEQFRVPSWAAGVERKLEIIRDTYRALFDEAATARAEYLEAAIVLLIVLEIVLAFVL